MKKSKPKTQHGGKRKGAGRPLLGADRRKRINVTLSESERQRAHWLGEGNVSRGLSRALQTCPDWSRLIE